MYVGIMTASKLQCTCYSSWYDEIKNLKGVSRIIYFYSKKSAPIFATRIVCTSITKTSFLTTNDSCSRYNLNQRLFKQKTNFFYCLCLIRPITNEMTTLQCTVSHCVYITEKNNERKLINQRQVISSVRHLKQNNK